MKANKRVRDLGRVSASPLRTVVRSKDGVTRNSTAHFDLSKRNNGSGGEGRLMRASR